MTSYELPLSVIVLPTIDGFDPNCCAKRSAPRTATFGPPGRSSSSVYQRPICGLMPKTSPNDAVVNDTRTRAGSPTPVRTSEPSDEPPIAANTWLRSFQSVYFGNDAGHVAHAGCTA